MTDKVGPRLNNRNDAEYFKLRSEHGYEVCRDLDVRDLLLKIANRYGLTKDDVIKLEDKIDELEQQAKEELK